MDKMIDYEWVIGAYTGDQAKAVKAHADHGIGYFFQREGGRGVSYTVYAAFRRPMDGPRADHLELANGQQVQKLEQLWNRRHGERENVRQTHRIMPAVSLQDMWAKRYEGRDD